MPHLIIDCSENVLSLQSPEAILQAVYDTAASTKLFAESGPGGIKVRLNPYRHFTTVNSQDDFIHVFGHIMEGRTDSQKKALSTAVVSRLVSLFPDIPIISMNVQEFERATYCNRSMV